MFAVHTLSMASAAQFSMDLSFALICTTVCFAVSVKLSVQYKDEQGSIEEK